MFAHNFIYISSGVVISLILCISEANGITNESSNHCAQWNHECDPHSQRPCCDPILSCKLKKSSSEFICGETTKLEASCDSDEDCNGIMHAKCSTEKKCVCRANNLRLNETYCAPLLGGFCWKNETCVTKNTMCIDNECRCSKNYSERENHCLPVIGSLRCHYDGQCAIIKFAKCSKNSYCVCSLNTTVINNTLCGPVSDSHCAADNDCVNNSVCKNNKCQCSSKYVTINGNQCVHPYIGMPCTDDDYCNFYINHTICSPENNCACSQNSYYYNRTLHSLFFNMSFTNYEDCKAEQAFCLDNKCYHHSVANFSDKSCSEDKNCFGSLLGELCDINEDCFPYNSVCSDRKCKCAMNYRNNSIFSCLPSMLNQNCWINSHCSAIPNAECSDYQCICKAGYVESNQKTCSPLLGTQCTEHDECTVRYSICFDEKCECTDYFTPLSNDRCGSALLQKTCETDRDCRNIKFSFCSSHNLCSCTKNAIALNGSACGALVNQYCSHDLPCVTENSVCVDYNCECKPFFKNSDAKCLPIRLGESCENNHDCNLIKYAKCSANGICSCLTNYVSISDTLCSPLLDERCQVNDECYITNSDCIANKCRCRDSFIAVYSNSRCESRTLGSQCITSKDCSMINYSICSSDKICICPPNYFAVDRYFCTPLINATCLNDLECLNDLFHCVDDKCQCKSGYTPISVDRCMETRFMYSCEETSECSDSWHWNCATSGKCVCRVDNIARNNSTCLPSLNGYCWRDDQCMAENSVCTDYHCRCKPHFVAVANNHCVFQIE
ncbi:hypothetical protein KQX54_004014 [Cotesia glomerata]|uniref:EGF-like domain-containing protein n=1 Tax=Cotesia glomerata TaxID=32391 RepID=A0AAV7HVG5_COTGL|nr:hypothetical protein KQX54_004014 [Cotesia glomerata]